MIGLRKNFNQLAAKALLIIAPLAASNAKADFVTTFSGNGTSFQNTAASEAESPYINFSGLVTGVTNNSGNPVLSVGNQLNIDFDVNRYVANISPLSTFGFYDGAIQSSTVTSNAFNFNTTTPGRILVDHTVTPGTLTFASTGVVNSSTLFGLNVIFTRQASNPATGIGLNSNLMDLESGLYQQFGSGNLRIGQDRYNLSFQFQPQMTAVPEPSSLAMLGMAGLVGGSVFVLRRRREISSATKDWMRQIKANVLSPKPLEAPDTAEQGSDGLQFRTLDV